MITVDRQVIEGAGTCTSRRPSAGSFVGRSTPRRTPDGHPLAERLAARIKDARAEQEAGEVFMAWCALMQVPFPAPVQQEHAD